MGDGAMQVQTYSQLMASTRAEPGAATLQVPEEWMQGRTVFGGLQAAVALKAMRTLVPDTPLRTLQGTFLAPVPGGAVTARARVLRQGKNAAHVEARIVDGDATLALLVGVFGTARASTVAVLPSQVPVASVRPIDFPFVKGVTPNFTQHFVVRYVKGLPPFTGDRDTRHVLEIGMRGDAAASEAHVLAIADFIPPVALSHLKTPSPGSTLTWMIEMMTDRVDGLPLSGWRVDAEMAAARDGYTSQSVMVWGPGGVPVATSRQSMVVFG